MREELVQLRDIVVAVARDELLPRFRHSGAREKADGSLVTEADTVAQARIAEALAARWPGVGLLGEEMSEAEQQRLLASGTDLWLLDPLDGTTNFAAGLPYFAPSVARLRDGEVVWGVVYDPVRDECFCAARGHGAWLNGKPLTAEPRLPLHQGIGLVDFKRLTPELAARVATAPPFASQRNFGSAALDWCTVAAGRGHVYLHGRQKLWDYAAGWLILNEAGGASGTLEGEPVFRPELVPRSVAAAATPELFETWMRWLKPVDGKA